MTNPTDALKLALFIAGIGQLVLAAGSVLIPRVLEWRRKLDDLDPLLRRLFWVYAGYILCTNFALGLVSVLLAHELATGGALALAVNLYASLYWLSRLVIQFALFRDLKPNGVQYRIAEVGFVLLFTFLTATYVVATIVALQAA